MKRSIFYKFFPPPQFLQMPAVGLDISDVSLRFAELIETRDGFSIGRFGEHAIPRGVIESGEVKKPAELRTIFQDIKKQYGLEYVSVALPEEKAYLFELKLPTMKYNEVRGAIEFSLEEHVPLKASEAIFDYEILKETESALYVTVSATPRTLVDGYLEAFSESGITPVVFEIETQSVARAVIPEGDKKSYLIVDFGEMRTGITIVSEEVVQFALTVSVGSGLLTDAIAKIKNVTHEEAEKIKREKGISPEGEMFATLTPSVALVRDEVVRHLSYWQTHDDDYGKKRPIIEKVYLCGGGANLVGIVEFLSGGLSIPVEPANAFANINRLDTYVPPISFDDSLRYTTSLGLALRRPR